VLVWKKIAGASVNDFVFQSLKHQKQEPRTLKHGIPAWLERHFNLALVLLVGSFGTEPTIDLATHRDKPLLLCSNKVQTLGRFISP